MPTRFSIETSKSGHPTLKCNHFYLHSRYNPVKEGGKICSQLDLNKKSCVIVYGMALGYHIEPLIQQGKKIIIIDKHPNIVSLLKETNRLSLFEGTRFFAGDLSQLSNWLSYHLDEQDSDSIHYFEHIPSVSLDKEFYQKAKIITGNAVKYKLQSYLTTLGFSYRWHNNILRNIRYLEYSHTLTSRSDRPVFIVGSGPSLDEHIPILPELKKRGIIIALAPALHRLIEAGVEPHFVISTDGGIANRIHIKREDQLQAKESICITTLSATPYLFRSWKGKVVLINQLLPLEEYLLSECLEIPMRGNVALTAFLFSLKLTNSAICLLGLDFAFTNRLYHFKGNRLEQILLYGSNRLATFESKMRQIIQRFQLTTVRNSVGKNVNTNLAMKSYLEWMEETIAESKRKVYSLDRKGARLKGVETIGHNKVMSIFPDKEDMNPSLFIKPLSNNSIDLIKQKLKDLKKELQKELERLESKEIKEKLHKKTLEDWITEISYPELRKIIEFAETRLFRKVKLSQVILEEDIEQLNRHISTWLFYINKVDEH